MKSAEMVVFFFFIRSLARGSADLFFLCVCVCTIQACVFRATFLELFYFFYKLFNPPTARLRRYARVVDQLTLRPVKEVRPGRPVVMPVAAKYGEVRLLDNVEIGGEAP